MDGPQRAKSTGRPASRRAGAPPAGTTNVTNRRRRGPLGVPAAPRAKSHGWPAASQEHRTTGEPKGRSPAGRNHQRDQPPPAGPPRGGGGTASEGPWMARSEPRAQDDRRAEGQEPRRPEPPT